MENESTIPTIAPQWGEEVLSQLSWFKIDRLKQANVMVVGCGALGSEVLKNLVLFGVGHLVIVDFDTVEATNMTRSVLFRREDAKANRPKVLVAAARLRELNPSVQILPICGDIGHDVGLGLLRRMDVVVGCVDNRWARYCLNRLCMRAGVPWVDGGIDGLEGTARVFVPGKNCYACNLGPEALKDLSYRISCSTAIRRNEQAGRVPTTPVIASIIGAVEAQEAVKLLHPEELARGELTSLCGKMFYYEGQHLAARMVDFVAYDADCPVHEQWAPVEAIPLSTEWRIDRALAYLAEKFGEESVEIQLRDYGFVDYLVVRRDERKIPVMLPDYCVEQFVEEEPTLCHLPFHALYQHSIRQLDAQFPDPGLTLAQVGVAPWDILQVTTSRGIHYVELADERGYAKLLFQSREA